jgi:hypothetical protein
MARRVNILFRIAGGLLFVTAIVKFISVFGHAKILNSHDPVFYMLTTKSLLFEAGVFEIMAGLTLMLNKSPLLKWMVLLFTCLCFWSYRLGVLIVNPGKPCPCFGTIFDWSPWLHAYAQYIALGILIFLTICLIPCNPRFQNSLGKHMPSQN